MLILLECGSLRALYGGNHSNLPWEPVQELGGVALLLILVILGQAPRPNSITIFKISGLKYMVSEAKFKFRHSNSSHS